jgi:hypothetical protein
MGGQGNDQIPTHIREELGVEVLAVKEIDSLQVDIHTELSAKWYKYTPQPIRSLLN